MGANALLRVFVGKTRMVVVGGSQGEPGAAWSPVLDAAAPLEPVHPTSPTDRWTSLLDQPVSQPPFCRWFSCFNSYAARADDTRPATRSA